MYRRNAEQERNGKAAPGLIARCRKKGLTWGQIAKVCGVSRLSPQLWAKGRAPAGKAFTKLQKLAKGTT